jgi:hypothetical protein
VRLHLGGERLVIRHLPFDGAALDDTLEEALDLVPVDLGSDMDS